MTEYAERDLSELDDHYYRHVSAMTAEKLHSKSAIAAELAWRDKRIEELEAGQQAAVDKALEEVALMVEGRAESRFAEYGTVETDTGAGYYSGSGGMFLDERDEEDEEIATAIRSRIGTKGGAK